MQMFTDRIIVRFRLPSTNMKYLRALFTLLVFVVVLIVAFLLWNKGAEAPIVEPIDEQQAENIRVTNLVSNSVVTSPLLVEGEARVFENSVAWQVRALDETVLGQGHFMADAPDIGQFGPFSEEIFLPVLNEESFYLDIFAFSAKDGERIDVVRRPLKVDNTQKTSVNVYFGDTDAIVAGDCTAVDFEKRTVHKTLAPAKLALTELINGTTAGWATDEMPEGTSLNSVTIVNGVAKVDFGSYYEQGWSGGSCKVSVLRAQIEQTLKQFDSVDSVEITVNGKSDSILQP